MSNEFRLDSNDEFPHRPGNELNFNESVYVNGFDLNSRCGGWMRLGNRVNEGHAEAQVCLYLPDGRIACQFQRPGIESHENFNAGGLSYEVIEPLCRVRMDYQGELMVVDDPAVLRDARKLFQSTPRVAASVSMQLNGTSPVHGGEPTRDDQQTFYGRDFSLGHFNQHTTTEVDIKIGDERWQFSGLGWRDHSWGPRYWTNIYYYRLLIANFGPDRAMMLLKISDRDGTTRRHGVLQYDGDYEEITDMDLITDWDQNKDPLRMRLNVKTNKRKATLTGEVVTLAPLRNRRKVGDETLACRIAEGLTVWQWDDREGMGVTEFIEFLENGEPVGYPL